MRLLRMVIIVETAKTMRKSDIAQMPIMSINVGDTFIAVKFIGYQVAVL